MATVEQEKTVRQMCEQAKAASHKLARLSDEQKDTALLAIAEAVSTAEKEILVANQADLEQAKTEGYDTAFIDKLALNSERVAQMAQGVRDIEALPDPVGEVIEGMRLKNGLNIKKVRVPLGVVAVVYEARPNVTVDVAALCLKSGNAVVLRGSSAASHSNKVLGKIVQGAAYGHGVPEGSIEVITGGERSEMAELATLDGLIDLIVPRGGEGLKAALKEVATVPVIYAAAGNCHVFVDAGANIEEAVEITIDAKTDRPGVCNAAETLLVHAEVAPVFLPKIFKELLSKGVELRTDARARSLATEVGDQLKEASEDDWFTEFHSMVLAVKVVDSVDEAIDHINHYGSGHSEAIVTSSVESAEDFTEGVDSACVYVNASTRFTDGGVFGMGAEIGNSTQKLHARGPIGLRELTTYKYVVEGTGQIRASNK